MNMYSNIEQFLYSIDCKLSQYYYPIEEPDQGYFIREKLLKEIREFQFVKEPPTVEQFLYSIDCKLSQYYYPIEEPDQGCYIRHQLLKEIRDADIVHEIKRLILKRRFQCQITEELITEAMHPCRMMARMQMCDDIEQFFECC